ncbi:hypothetical protein [Dysgonomonas macrotermitis]|uniref:Glycosyl transferase family 2 n=1 Tax=Dysgonomonas macrotermitis TaxID=1346286 RepID=A0A1M5AEG8_9BACT|nr:hypothetical protein [Dysgonomonas macrotermitis]SHF28688.1 hypothetical protein SAMN05444362_10526 [Dysgonomonas macrotermitis]
MKKKVAILVRVYDRVEDLNYNLQIIRDTWHTFDYEIIVISNGYKDGYLINENTKQLVDNLIILDHNWGHRKGSAQLLQEGRKHIPDDCDYTIILEADTWIYSDDIVSKYVRLLDDKVNVVWASADWYDKDYSLAVDFAIVKSDFIRTHFDLFDIDLYPECYIANYLKKADVGFISITENMPVHIPSYMPKYPCIDDSANKRFYIFPKAKMVTHHIEFLKGGINEKKQLFNVITGTNYFTDISVKNRRWKRIKPVFWIYLSYLLPKKSWFKAKVYRKLD